MPTSTGVCNIDVIGDGWGVQGVFCSVMRIKQELGVHLVDYCPLGLVAAG